MAAAHSYLTRKLNVPTGEMAMNWGHTSPGPHLGVIVSLTVPL